MTKHAQILALSLSLSLSLVLAAVSCTRNPEAAIFLTFDDGAVNDWFALADSLQDIDYKATYYVTLYHEMDSLKKSKLKELYERGHEIGNHSYDHTVITSYVKKGMDVYLKEQIFPLQQLLAANGYAVKHFAYPYGIDMPGSDTVLLKHFKTVRKVAYTHGYPLDQHNVSLFSGNTPESSVLWGAGIDKHYQIREADLIKALDVCAKEKKSLLLLAHYVGIDSTNEWQTDLSMLIRVLRYAHKQGLKFKTVSELDVENPYYLGSQ